LITIAFDDGNGNFDEKKLIGEAQKILLDSKKGLRLIYAVRNNFTIKLLVTLNLILKVY
jgi:hypothetical protein